ncbi:MAG TPA: anthrone oxygenase family protein [Nocardioidaceae bacterium]|nr:anthrone oxygenase family protein [Nocardioidaceae bacterium]
MSDTLRDVVLASATITMGLNAGLFYAFSVSVMLGLRRVDDRAFVHVMQQINVAILNGWFAIIFVGPGMLTILAAALQLVTGNRSALLWTVAGLVCYTAMIAITLRVNVPLNNQLAGEGEPDQVADLRAVRERFEGRWVRWNIARTVASAAAFGCLACALVLTS